MGRSHDHTGLQVEQGSGLLAMDGRSSSPRDPLNSRLLAGQTRRRDAADSTQQSRGGEARGGAAGEAMTILDTPVKVDLRGERLYFHAPGEVCVDICSGAPEDRARVLALLAQAQEAMRILRDFCDNYEMGSGPDARMAAILRNAKVLP